MTVVGKAFRFDVLEVSAGVHQISLPHCFDSSQPPPAVFIHNGTAVLGEYDGGKIRAWSVSGQKIFTLKHPGKIRSHPLFFFTDISFVLVGSSERFTSLAVSIFRMNAENKRNETADNFYNAMIILDRTALQLRRLLTTQYASG